MDFIYKTSAPFSMMPPDPKPTPPPPPPPPPTGDEPDIPG